MNSSDPRRNFILHRDKLMRSIRSGDRAAPARLDALITEMQHVLGLADPDTLETLLEYVEMQELQGREMNIWRSLDEDLAVLDATFGADSHIAGRARFVSVMQGVHSLTWSFGLANIRLDDPDYGGETASAEVVQDRKVRRDRVVQEFGPAVIQLARAQGLKGDLSDIVTHASDCVCHLLEGDVDDATYSLSQIPPAWSSGESLAWLVDPLTFSISLCRNAEGLEDSLDLEDACRELERFADGVADDPEWVEFFEEHEVGLILAQLLNAGLAEPTEEGVSLIQRAWDAAVARLEG